MLNSRFRINQSQAHPASLQEVVTHSRDDGVSRRESEIKPYRRIGRKGHTFLKNGLTNT